MDIYVVYIKLLPMYFYVFMSILVYIIWFWSEESWSWTYLLSGILSSVYCTENITYSQFNYCCLHGFDNASGDPQLLVVFFFLKAFYEWIQVCN